MLLNMIEKNFVRRTWRRAVRPDGVKIFRVWNTILGILFILFIWLLQMTHDVNLPNTALKDVLKCATNNIHADLSFLDAAKAIHTDEFLERRDRLAEALVASDADAFVLEPGFAFQCVVPLVIERLLFSVTYKFQRPDTTETYRKLTGNHGSLKSGPS